VDEHFFHLPERYCRPNLHKTQRTERNDNNIFAANFVTTGTESQIG